MYKKVLIFYTFSILSSSALAFMELKSNFYGSLLVFGRNDLILKTHNTLMFGGDFFKMGPFYSYEAIFDSIVAARAGSVIEVEESNVDGNGCPDDNHVYIEHTDGSVAHYLHLTKDGVLVNVGDSITQGQAIALAGNTGCSTDSHLHFVIYKSRDYNESLPITFSNTAANPRGLKADTNYTAL